MVIDCIHNSFFCHEFREWDATPAKKGPMLTKVTSHSSNGIDHTKNPQNWSMIESLIFE